MSNVFEKAGKFVGRYNPFNHNNSMLNRAIGAGLAGSAIYANTGSANSGPLEFMDFRGSDSNSILGFGNTNTNSAPGVNKLLQSGPNGVTTNYLNNNNNNNNNNTKPWYATMSKGTGMLAQGGLGLAGSMIAANAQNRIADQQMQLGLADRADARKAAADSVAANKEAGDSMHDAYMEALEAYKKKNNNTGAPTTSVVG